MKKARVLTGYFYKGCNYYGVVGHIAGEEVEVLSLEEAIKKEPNFELYFRDYCRDGIAEEAKAVGFVYSGEEDGYFPVFRNDIEFIE